MKKCIRMLAESGREHQIDKSRKWSQEFFGKFRGELELGRCKSRQWVQQGSHWFGIHHLRLRHLAEDDRLDELFSKGNRHQAAGLNVSLQLFRQVVIENAGYLGR